MECKDGFGGSKKQNVTWTTRNKLDWLLNLALVDLEAEWQLAKALSDAGPARCVSGRSNSVRIVTRANENHAGETGQKTD